MKHLRVLFILLTIFSISSCRDDIIGFSSDKADLSVSISVNKSLYQGTLGENNNTRFIDLSSKSVALTYTVGSTVYSTSVSLTADSNNPDKLTGTAVLDGLPAHVNGTVKVETFNINNILVCDESQEIELSQGDNQVTLTLKISEDSPLLSNMEQREYLLRDIPPGESRFLRIGPLSAGQEYYLIGATLDGLESDDIVHILDETGSPLTIIEKPDHDGLFFVPTVDDSYVIFSFYNNGSITMPGYAWWDSSFPYTSLVNMDNPGGFTYQINMDNVSSDISIWGSFNSYIRMAASKGRLYVSSQDEGSNTAYAWTENGTTWNSVLTSDLVDTDVNALGPSDIGIADISSDSGFLFIGSFYRYYFSPDNHIGYSLSITDMTSTFELDALHADSINYVSNGAIPLRNNRISHSISHIAMASAELASSDLYIRMAPVSPGDIGNYSSAVSIGFDIGTTADNLEIAAIDDSCYILGDSGSVYRYDYNNSSLSLSPIFSVPSSTNTYRHMSPFNYKYPVASSPDFARLFLPESGTVLTFFDSSNPPQEVVDLTDLGYTVDYHLYASKGYLINVLKIDVGGGDLGIVVSISPDGGFTWIQSDPVLVSTSTFDILDADVDESVGEFYVSSVIDEGNLTYRIFTFSLQ